MLFQRAYYSGEGGKCEKNQVLFDSLMIIYQKYTFYDYWDFSQL